MQERDTIGMSLPLGFASGTCAATAWPGLAVRGNIGERFEIESEIACRMEALRGILFQAMADDALERGRNVARGFGKLGRLFFEDRAHGVGSGVAVEGAFAGEHFVEDRAEGKDVGAVIGGLAADLLGRHVAGGAHDQCRVRWRRGRWARRRRSASDFGPGQLGQTEVEDLDAAVFGEEDVFGLEVAVDDALFVRGGEAAGDLQGILDRLAEGRAAVRRRSRSVSPSSSSETT